MPGSAPVAPPPPLVFDRPTVNRQRRRRRTRRRALAALIAVVLVIVVIVASGVAYVEYRNSQISRVTVKGITAVPPSGVENVLLVGNNSRCALNGQQSQSFGTCSEVGGARSDVTMLLHLDPSRNSATILSIPRDLFLPIPGSTSANRVDDALNTGPERLVETVEDDLGITINHFAELDFDSFQGVVNALGGVSMYFPDPVKDSYSGLNIATAGCHFLNGTQALAVVRARHLYYKSDGQWVYDGLGDLSRIQRDHEFLRVVSTAISKRGLDDPLTDNSILGSVTPQLKVDSSFGIGEMLGLVLKFHSVNPQAAPQTTMPVIVDPNNYSYGGANYGSVVLPAEPQDQEAIDRFLGITSVPGSGVAPRSVTVSVMNGTGVSGQAEQTASSLAASGFDVVGAGNAASIGPVSETAVYYSAGHRTEAEKVLQSISGSVVMGQGPTQDGADVTVVTGSDFAMVQPTGPSGSVSAGSTQSTSSPASSETASATSAAGLWAPTSPSQALPPYDPRSCTASGAAGP